MSHNTASFMTTNYGLLLIKIDDTCLPLKATATAEGLAGEVIVLDCRDTIARVLAARDGNTALGIVIMGKINQLIAAGLEAGTPAFEEYKRYTRISRELFLNKL